MAMFAKTRVTVTAAQAQDFAEVRMRTVKQAANLNLVNVREGISHQTAHVVAPMATLAPVAHLENAVPQADTVEARQPTVQQDASQLLELVRQARARSRPTEHAEAQMGLSVLVAALEIAALLQGTVETRLLIV